MLVPLLQTLAGAAAQEECIVPMSLGNSAFHHRLLAVGPVPWDLLGTSQCTFYCSFRILLTNMVLHTLSFWSLNNFKFLVRTEMLARELETEEWVNEDSVNRPLSSSHSNFSNRCNYIWELQRTESYISLFIILHGIHCKKEIAFVVQFFRLQCSELQFLHQLPPPPCNWWIRTSRGGRLRNQAEFI